jgi:hypothetical protein
LLTRQCICPGKTRGRAALWASYRNGDGTCLAADFHVWYWRKSDLQTALADVCLRGEADILLSGRWCRFLTHFRTFVGCLVAAKLEVSNPRNAGSEAISGHSFAEHDLSVTTFALRAEQVRPLAALTGKTCCMPFGNRHGVAALCPIGVDVHRNRRGRRHLTLQPTLADGEVRIGPPKRDSEDARFSAKTSFRVAEPLLTL